MQPNHRESCLLFCQLCTDVHANSFCTLYRPYEYYRSFIPVAMFLQSRRRISEGESSRMFAKGFQCEIWNRILCRLQIKFPDHFPDDPYPLDNIFQAAQFVLHGTASSHSASPFASDPPVASRAIEDLLGHLIDAVTLLKSSPLLSPSFASSLPKLRTYSRPGATSTCNFCGSATHLIKRCPEAAAYIRIGKCRRNAEGRIVLPTGSYVARDVPGDFLKFRIDEWHRRHPGHLAHDLLAARAASHCLSASHTPHPVAYDMRQPSPVTRTPIAPLSIQNRVASLQQELFDLQTRMRIGASLPSPHHEAVPSPDSRITSYPLDSHCATPELVNAAPHHRAPSVASSPSSASSVQSLPTPQFPSYAPPHEYNFGIAPKAFKKRKCAPVARMDAPENERGASDDSGRVLSSRSPAIRCAYPKLDPGIDSLTPGEPTHLSSPVLLNFASSFAYQSPPFHSMPSTSRLRPKKPPPWPGSAYLVRSLHQLPRETLHH